MEDWEKRTIRKLGWMGIDYCVDCGRFVAGRWSGHRNCLVVRILET